MNNISKVTALLCAFFLVLSPVRINAEPLPEAGSDEFFELRELIAKVIEATLPGQASYICRLALAAVIVNRAADPRFPDDIRSVVYERGEFECTSRESFSRVRPSYLSKSAARDAMLGCDVTAGAVYFRRAPRSEVPDGCFYHSGYVFFREMPESSRGVS